MNSYKHGKQNIFIKKQDHIFKFKNKIIAIKWITSHIKRDVNSNTISNHIYKNGIRKSYGTFIRWDNIFSNLRSSRRTIIRYKNNLYKFSNRINAAKWIIKHTPYKRSLKTVRRKISHRGIKKSNGLLLVNYLDLVRYK